MRPRCLLSIVVLSAGCAAVNPRAGLGDVERLVAARSTLTVSWPADGSTRRRGRHRRPPPLRSRPRARCACTRQPDVAGAYAELDRRSRARPSGPLPNPVLTPTFVPDSAFRHRHRARPGAGSDRRAADSLKTHRRRRGQAEVAKIEVADAVATPALDAKATFYRLAGRRAAVGAPPPRRRAAARSGVGRRAPARRREHQRSRASRRSRRSTRRRPRARHRRKRERAERETSNALLGLTDARTAWTSRPSSTTSRRTTS
jgi:hypothetical protein